MKVSFGAPTAAAESFAIAIASSSPCTEVQAFALPLLATMPRTIPLEAIKAA